MFSRNSMLRRQSAAAAAATADPLTSDHAQMQPAPDNPRASPAPSRGYEVLKEIKSSAASSLGLEGPSLSRVPSGEGGFPSTGFSRTTRKVSKSLSTPPRRSTPAAATTPQSEPAPVPELKEDGGAVAALLPHASLGRRLWLFFQAAPELADLRDMIADSPTGVLVLPQSPYRGTGEPNLAAMLNDNVLFTDRAFSVADEHDSHLCKFTTTSGICGLVDRGSVSALGTLPPMEDIMLAINDSESPRSTIFDVFDADLLSASPLQRLRIASIHKNCLLPDSRRVQVVITSGPLERNLVVDSALTTLSATIYESLDATYSALLPHAPVPISTSDHVKVDIECIMQHAHAIELRAHSRTTVSKSKESTASASTVPNIDIDTESWQAHMLQLQDHIMSYLADLERETSMCGDVEARKKISTALVECVEKLATEAMYPAIFSPWFTDDRSQDDLFASKVAALNIAGITLDHLGVATPAESTGADLLRICSETGRLFEDMNSVRSPAEKLKLVVDAHKTLVDRMDRLNARASRLSKLRSQSVSHEPAAKVNDTSEGGGGGPLLLSADSILPLLIYSLVKANPPRFISNLRYIQRYRIRSLLTSQFEYCMTNALAAASFVASVDARKLGLSAEVSSSALERAMSPALAALHNLLVNNVVSSVGIDVVQGVADGGKKVAVGVFDATLGRLIDSSSQFISSRRAPWRAPSSALEQEQELQQGAKLPADSADESNSVADQSSVVSGVKTVLSSASEQLSHEIRGHLPRATLSPRISARHDSLSLPEIHERFLDMSVGDLTINEVSVLLASYKELAAFVRK